MVFFYLIFAAALVLVDRLIKHWAVTQLQPLSTIPLIQDVLHLTYSENRGAAFSILNGKTEFLMVVNTILLLVLLYILLTRKMKHPLAMVSISLMFAGGLGNMIDRFLYPGHFVVDYIDFRLINFAIFNFADVCVVCGVGLLMLYYLLIEGKEEKKAGPEGSEGHD